MSVACSGDERRAQASIRHTISRSQRASHCSLSTCVAFYAAITILWMWSLLRLLYGILPFLVGFMLLGLASAADWVVAVLSTTSVLFG